jgi:tetratricopeptide (TPR) repeat protein
MSSLAATRARLFARFVPALRRAPSLQYLALSSHRKFSASASFHSDDEVASTPRAPSTSTSIESDKEALEIQSMIQRVHELCATAQYADALPIAKDVRKRAFHHFGSPSPVFASCVNNHALILKALGRLDEAANLFDLALLNYESGVGKQHPSYLTALANLANVYDCLFSFIV